MNTMDTLEDLGFTEAQMRHFQALKLRYERGEFNVEWTTRELGRLHYIRWLIAQGRLSG